MAPANPCIALYPSAEMTAPPAGLPKRLRPLASLTTAFDGSSNPHQAETYQATPVTV